MSKTVPTTPGPDPEETEERVSADIHEDGAIVAEADRKRAVRALTLGFSLAVLLLLTIAGMLGLLGWRSGGIAAGVSFTIAGVTAVVALLVAFVAVRQVREFAATGQVPTKPEL